MKVSNINNNVSFGALYMPTIAHIERQTGSYMAVEAEKAKPELEKLAENFDVFIETNNESPEKLGFDISVREIPKNIFKKMFGKPKEMEISAKLSDIASLHSFTLKTDGEFVPKLKNENYGMAEYLTEQTSKAIKYVKDEILIDEII